MDKIDRRQMTGTCPVCGGSWKGPRYFFLYKRAMTESGLTDVTDRELREYIRRKDYPSENQSTLMEDTESGLLLCPHCRTAFGRGE